MKVPGRTLRSVWAGDWGGWLGRCPSLSHGVVTTVSQREMLSGVRTGVWSVKWIEKSTRAGRPSLDSSHTKAPLQELGVGSGVSRLSLISGAELSGPHRRITTAWPGIG